MNTNRVDTEPLVLAFVGPPGSGKDVFLSRVAGFFQMVGMKTSIVDEVATSLRQHGLPINEDTTFRVQLQILLETMAKTVGFQNTGIHHGSPHIVLCNRYLIDNLTFLLLAARRQGVAPEQIDGAIQMVIGYHQANPGDYCFFQGGKPEYLVSDGVRSVNEAFQQLVQEEMVAVQDMLEKATMSSASKFGWIPLPEDADNGEREFRQLMVVIEAITPILMERLPAKRESLEQQIAILKRNHTVPSIGK